MNTLRLPVDPGNLNSEHSQSSLERAAGILRRGGLVAFPTETVYGLGANALDASAVERIFIAKQRPGWDPLIVHISDEAMLASITEPIPESATRLIEAFWPGPLTLLLPRSEAIPANVTSGRPRVGVRMPAHPVAHALIERAGIPIAAPSANTFGRISPTLAEHVLEDLDGRVDAVLDSGETTHGLESTVVDPCEDPVIVYRPGVIGLEQIRAVCGEAFAWRSAASIDRCAAVPESLPSPGVGLRHYAPRARLVLIEGDSTQGQRLVDAVHLALGEGRRIGVMLPDGLIPSGGSFASKCLSIYPWGLWRDHEQLAHRLFAGLRALDAAGVSMILCPLPPDTGIGTAIRDRLLKAAKAA